MIYYKRTQQYATRHKETKNEFFIIPYFPMCCLYPFCTYIDIFIISVFVPRCTRPSNHRRCSKTTDCYTHHTQLLYFIIIIIYRLYRAFATNYYFYELTETTTCDDDGTQYYIQFIIIYFSGYNCTGNFMHQVHYKHSQYVILLLYIRLTVH